MNNERNGSTRVQNLSLLYTEMFLALERTRAGFWKISRRSGSCYRFVEGPACYIERYLRLVCVLAEATRKAMLIPGRDKCSEVNDFLLRHAFASNFLSQSCLERQFTMEENRMVIAVSKVRSAAPIARM